MRVIQSAGFTRRVTGIIGSFLVVAIASPAAAQQSPDSPASAQPVSAALTAAPRPRLPADLSQAWLVPARPGAAPASRPLADFAAAMRHFAEGKYAAALPLFGSPSLASTPLAAYASFYTGLCHLNLSRAADARAIFAKLHAAQIGGFLGDAAVAREAEAAGLLGDHAAAARLYLELSGRKTAAPDEVLLALGRARQAAGNREQAAEAFALLYYEFPLSESAAVAATELDGLGRLPLAAGFDRPLQARPRPRGAAVRRQALPGRPRRLPGPRPVRGRRRCGGGGVADGGVRPLPAAIPPGARPAGAVPRSRVPQGRSAVLLPDRDARAGRSRRVRQAEPGAGRGVPRQLLGRRDAQQPRQPFHHRRRGRTGRRRVPRTLREVPAGASRRARRVEGRLVGVPQPPVQGGRLVFRKRRRHVSQVRLQAVVPLLGWQGPRPGWRRRRGRLRSTGSSPPTT